MELSDYASFALNNITHNSLRTWLTMIGIFLGIATIVSLLSLGQGLQDAIGSQFSQLGTDKITFQNSQGFSGPPGTMVAKKLNDHDLGVMKSVKGFELVFGRLLRFDKVDFNKKTVFTALISLPKKTKEMQLAYEVGKWEAESGELLNVNDRGKILIGNDYAHKEVFSRNLRVGDKLLIHDKEFEISSILKKTGALYGEAFVVMAEEDMKEILGIDDEWDLIVGKVSGGVDAVAVGEVLKRTIRRDRGIRDPWNDDFTVQTPQDMLKTFGNVLLIVQAVLVGIAAVSLLVGGIGIMNTMYTSVLERTKQIGIMKSIGARNSTILILFMIESGMLGFVGGVIGLGLGVSFSYMVEYVGTLVYGSALIQASYPPFLLIGALLFSFFIGAMAGTFPALQAAHLKPVDALRYRK
ncbi:MAG: ABC transporter permease [Candidatus Woesearchaeota archaeon]